MNWFRDRGFLHVTFKDKKNNQEIHVFNTHMNLVGKDIRYKQSLQLCNHIRKHTSNQDCIIVTGDFNVENKHEKAITLFENDLHFDNISNGLGNTILFSNYYRDWFNRFNNKEKQCDFTFIKNLQVIMKQMVSGNNLYTDHECFFVQLS